MLQSGLMLFMPEPDVNQKGSTYWSLGKNMEMEEGGYGCSSVLASTVVSPHALCIRYPGIEYLVLQKRREWTNFRTRVCILSEGWL